MRTLPSARTVVARVVHSIYADAVSIDVALVHGLAAEFSVLSLLKLRGRFAIREFVPRVGQLDAL